MAGIDELVTEAVRKYGDAAQGDHLTAMWTGLRHGRNDHGAVNEFVERLNAAGHRRLAAETVQHISAARLDLPWPLLMQAAMETMAGRPAAALAIGQTLRERFPEADRGRHVVIAALTRLRRFDEAEQALAEARHSTPDALWLLADTAGLAEARGDWPALLQAGAAWREGVKDRPQPAAAMITALIGLKQFDEADRIVGEALAAFPANDGLRRSAVAVAEARGDVAAAFARWSEMCDAQPDNRAGFAGMLALARRTRRLDYLGDRLKQAVERFANDREILSHAATIAGFEDWQEADRLWQRLQLLFPQDPEIALNVATVMIGVRRERRKQLAEVLTRLASVHVRFPDYEPAYVSHLEALRLAGSLDEAASCAAEWAQRFPNALRLALARIAVAEERGAWDDALGQVEALRRRERPSAELEAIHVRVLSRAGRLDEAEAVCRSALETYADDRDLLSEHARLASRRADWAEAVARWVEAQRRRPGDWKITEELRLLRQQLAGEGIGDAASPQSADEVNNLFSRFESLGGTTTGCEFGMVQSQFGSRNVSLLRWTKSDIDILTEALECEFDGVGSEDNTLLTTVRVSADREEYVTSDKRFDMASNTFINVTDAPRDKMFQQTCRRLRFLRGKLIEDLHAAEKVFVFKIAHQVSDEAIRRLHRALGRYGDVRLMCVKRAEDGHAPGSVHWLEPGLLIGYVSYFLESAEGGARGIEFEVWKKLTLQADLLFRPAQQAA